MINGRNKYNTSGYDHDLQLLNKIYFTSINCLRRYGRRRLCIPCFFFVILCCNLRMLNGKPNVHEEHIDRSVPCNQSSIRKHFMNNLRPEELFTQNLSQSSFTYEISNENFCSLSAPHALIFFISKSTNFGSRNAIRRTWDEIRDLGTKIHPESDDKKFEYEIELNESKTDENSPNCKPFKCTIYVLASHGVSIISDIDDTIKVSNVLKTRSLLKHTFYSYFKPVDGMSELYQKWSEQKCQFHYVSASPWQLYPALRCFLEKYKYPMGTMNLRKFAWSLKFLKAPDEYKIETITPIIRAYPERKYILVGDSGELDPEIYSKLYSTFPQNIAHIFIRDICRTPECLLTCHERYIKTFENVPHERYTIFKDPKEIETSIEKLIST
ncbi:unnamed protein product [Adineta steineri]|uniref:Phosphatidate phosphatase APP1 catalytic domain-containing protein n=1 Tax=Adineta steineri TaxID=433720 RepID=A0A814G0J4_9BILA|nr:unnamed protein product [Adineta steineri]